MAIFLGVNDFRKREGPGYEMIDSRHCERSAAIHHGNKIRSHDGLPRFARNDGFIFEVASRVTLARM